MDLSQSVQFLHEGMIILALMVGALIALISWVIVTREMASKATIMGYAITRGITRRLRSVDDLLKIGPTKYVMVPVPPVHIHHGEIAYAIDSTGKLIELSVPVKED